jgi:hypothetical protein
MTRPFAAWVGYLAAAGRSGAAGETTNLLSSAPAHYPTCTNSRPTPRSLSPSAQDRRTLSSPLDPPKSPNPLSTLAINLPKTWHSYPLQLSTIEVGQSFPSPTTPHTRPPPDPARGGTFTLKASEKNKLDLKIALRHTDTFTLNPHALNTLAQKNKRRGGRGGTPVGHTWPAPDLSE